VGDEKAVCLDAPAAIGEGARHVSINVHCRHLSTVLRDGKGRRTEKPTPPCLRRSAAT
jgi:hypothetical protein